MAVVAGASADYGPGLHFLTEAMHGGSGNIVVQGGPAARADSIHRQTWHVPRQRRTTTSASRS